jgi:hypothetical protein
VRDDAGGRLLWVSAFGAPGEFQFVCSYTFPGEGRKLFGLLKYRGQSGPALDLSLAETRRAVELFLEENHAELLRLVSA